MRASERTRSKKIQQSVSTRWWYFSCRNLWRKKKNQKICIFRRKITAMLAERASEQFFLQICTYRYPKYSAECQRFCSKMVDRISACLLPGRTDIVICVENAKKVEFSTQITNRFCPTQLYSCTGTAVQPCGCTGTAVQPCSCTVRSYWEWFFA